MVGPVNEQEQKAKQEECNKQPEQTEEQPIEEEDRDQASEAELREREAAWQAERDSLIRQITQLKADFDNYKRRSQSQMEAVQERACESLIEELLPVLDNMELAQRSIKDEDPVGKGVQMIYDNLLARLHNQGLEPIDCIGQEFDPDLHEAISMLEGDGDELKVTKELQKGYLYKGKVLRPSKVEVTKQSTTMEEDE